MFPRVPAAELRWKIGKRLFALHFSALCGWCFFAAGMVLWGVRFFTKFAPWLPLLAVTLIIAAVYAMVKAIRLTPDIKKLTVWLDSMNHAGGLLAASGERRIEAWEKSIPEVNLPSVKCSLGKPLCIMLCGAAFFAGSILVPVGENAVSGKKRKLDISGETAVLEEKLEVLSSEKLITPEELTEFQESLADLDLRNDAGEAGRIYELLDALNNKLDNIGGKAGNKAVENLQTLEMLGSIADTMGMSPESRQQIAAQNELGELMSQLAAANPDIAGLMRKAVSEMKKNSASGKKTMSKEAMKKMAESMRANAGQWRDRIARMQNAKLMKNQCAKPGKCRGKDGSCDGTCGGSETLEEWLERNAAGAESLKQSMNDGKPGKGGVSRGPGAAELTMSGELPELEAQKEIGVALGLDPNQSTVLDRFSSAPVNADKEREGAAAGSLQTGNTAVEQRERIVYPAHKRALKEYFK